MFGQVARPMPFLSGSAWWHWCTARGALLASMHSYSTCQEQGRLGRHAQQEVLLLCVCDSPARGVLAALRKVVLNGEALFLALAFAIMLGWLMQTCRAGACSWTAQQLGWGTEHAPDLCAQIDDLTFVMSQEEIDQVQNAILTT